MKSKYVFSFFFCAFLAFAVFSFWMWVILIHWWLMLVFMCISIAGAWLSYYLVCEAQIFDL